MGNRLTHASPTPARTACVPPQREPRRLAAWLVLAALILALTLSAGLRPRPGDAGFATATPAPAVAAAGDARQGDPRQGEQRGEFPVKKPRVGSLRVRTSHAARVVAQGFHLQGRASAPGARPPAPAIASSPSLPAHRADPALRLHPGQAPPRAA